MDLRKLKKLIDLVQESGIAELEITEGEERVKIVRGGRGAPRGGGHRPGGTPRRRQPRPRRLPPCRPVRRSPSRRPTATW